MNGRAKKVAIVSDAVYPFNKGGKEKRIHDITIRLVAQGYDVTIYCMKWWKGPEKEIMENGVRLHAISSYYPLYTGNRRSIKEAIFFALSCFKLITRDFDVIDIDHMPHLVLFTTKIVCILKRKKMIVTWHEVWGKAYWKKYLGAMGIIAYWIERISAKLPDSIISVSPQTTAALRATLKVKKEIFTVPIGVDYETILKIRPAKQKSDIIFAGRLLSHKNVDILLQAVKIISKNNPQVLALIVGDGPEKEKLKKLALELNIEKNVSFLGFIEDHADLYALMRSSRTFVLPSTREGFGIAAVEANACGLPIITIDHAQNATKDLIKNGENGSLVPLDKEALAEAITRALAATEDQARYHAYAEKYNWKSIVAEIQRAYAI
jgi:glycosyltransferase involved in cell wall biosynthesis